MGGGVREASGLHVALYGEGLTVFAGFCACSKIRGRKNSVIHQVGKAVGKKVCYRSIGGNVTISLPQKELRRKHQNTQCLILTDANGIFVKM